MDSFFSNITWSASREVAAAVLLVSLLLVLAVQLELAVDALDFDFDRLAIWKINFINQEIDFL